MGNQGFPGDRKRDGNKKDKKFEPAASSSRVGRKQRRQKGSKAIAWLPPVTSLSKCCLRILKHRKPRGAHQREPCHRFVVGRTEYYIRILSFVVKDQLELDFAILMHNKRNVLFSLSTSCFGLLPGVKTMDKWVIRLNYLLQILSVVGLLQDEVDPMVSVMKVEIKEAVKLPLTHPELHEDIGIRLPKGVILYGEQGIQFRIIPSGTGGTYWSDRKSVRESLAIDR
ncbi:unnamed protein product [Musa acuminata subsp. malaccensis]|uniref:(wild Malaysian banana) hypothetical protein n=1 Tax=Musa acuminata subsp. malaccensis TaxID=214687 RepID=A0A804INZ8_MUSAM|nr:unnamed protein product [Musa acuminata subsp. malaccensis]